MSLIQQFPKSIGDMESTFKFINFLRTDIKSDDNSLLKEIDNLKENIKRDNGDFYKFFDEKFLFYKEKYQEIGIDIDYKDYWLEVAYFYEQLGKEVSGFKNMEDYDERRLWDDLLENIANSRIMLKINLNEQYLFKIIISGETLRFLMKMLRILINIQDMNKGSKRKIYMKKLKSNLKGDLGSLMNQELEIIILKDNREYSHGSITIGEFLYLFKDKKTFIGDFLNNQWIYKKSRKTVKKMGNTANNRKDTGESERENFKIELRNIIEEIFNFYNKSPDIRIDLKISKVEPVSDPEFFFLQIDLTNNSLILGIGLRDEIISLTYTWVFDGEHVYVESIHMKRIYKDYEFELILNLENTWIFQKEIEKNSLDLIFGLINSFYFRVIINIIENFANDKFFNGNMIKTKRLVVEIVKEDSIDDSLGSDLDISFYIRIPDIGKVSSRIVGQVEHTTQVVFYAIADYLRNNYETEKQLIVPGVFYEFMDV